MEEIKKTKLILSLKKKKLEKNINTEVTDTCMLNNKCPYYKKYIKYRNQILAFISSQEKLKLVNQSLHTAIVEKNKKFKEVKDENNYLKGIIYNLTGIKISDFSYNSNKLNNNIETSPYLNTSPNINNKYSINNSILNSEGTKTNRKINDKTNIERIPPEESKKNNLNNFIRTSQTQKKTMRPEKMLKISFGQKLANSNNNNRYALGGEDNQSPSFQRVLEQRAKTIRRRGSTFRSKLPNYNPQEYYEMINNYTKKQKFQSLTKEINSSYISLDIDMLEILNNNTSLKKLEYLSKNDENFIKVCKTGTNDILFKYCDYINLLINDYKEVIKVCTRMKDLIKGSINLIESIVANDSSKKFIEIACYILKCDRISLFIYDKNSDKLFLITAEGLNRAQIKMETSRGIVGNCFTECKVIRIEDAYLDERFDKEIDRQTNYRTKTLLCYPLVDKEGECIGVIEAINKYNSVFTDDDQEILKILSQQAASIFKNVSSHKNNRHLVVSLYTLIDYSIKINYVNNIYEFCNLTENLVLNIFNCLEAAIYFVKDGKLIRFFKNNEYKFYDINYGIVGRVIKSKEIIGYKSLFNVKELNTLIDLTSSDGLLTFPIMAKKTKEVCCVIQAPFGGEINKYGKPKENSMNIIKKLSKCVKNWIFKNKDCLNV